MSIKDIREYRKNPVPQRLLKLLSYTLVEDYLN